jgi:probable addiction module antidote protein
MPKRTRDYHEFLLEQLADPVFAADYLNEARQDSQKMFLKALRNVAESRRMAVVAAEAGVNRESLYRTLSEEGNPRLETFDSVLNALGLDYVFMPKAEATGSAIPTPLSAQVESNPNTSLNYNTGNIVETASTWTGNGTTMIFINTSTSQADIRASYSDVPLCVIADDKRRETVSQFS